ncbi:MAG: hypothetical protein ACM3SQ_13280 [Betaproteobacteria bacterium]
MNGARPAIAAERRAPFTRLQLLQLSLVLILACRTAYLATIWFAGVPGATRFRIETSAVWLVALGLLLAWTRRQSAEALAEPASATWPAWTALLWCAAAIALYLPVLSVGFLSDDFVLARHARLAEFGAFNPDAFRPLPLIAWDLLLAVGGGASSIHVLNIVLHGLVAYLTVRIASAFVGRAWAIAAGLLVLTFPLAPEAVAWSSGVFDVAATCLVLSTIVVARGYDRTPSVCRRLAFFAFGAAAVLCKETALVLPALILLDALARRSFPKGIVLDSSILMAAAGTIGVVRLAFASATIKQPITKYLVQRWIFETVGALVAPMHIDVIRSRPLLPVAEALVLLGLLTLFLAGRHGTGVLRAAGAYAAFGLSATLPAITIFIVAPDLQQSRYVYLAAIGYAVVLVICAASVARTNTLLRAVAVAVLGVVLAINTTALRAQQRPWVEAGRLRDAVIRAFASDSRIHQCPSVVLSDLPDNYRGAYIFRNGAPEALASPPVVVVNSIEAAPGPCSFAWNAERRQFVAGSR